MGKLLEQIGDYWDKRAPSYSEGLFSEFEVRVWDKVFGRELPKKKCRILDIGTGPGFFAWLLTSEGHDVTAVDYTDGMLDQARKNCEEFDGRITFLQMDAQELAFPDESFDVIVNRNVTWNLEDPARAYREWNRVLKPGGLLLIFDAPWYEYLFDEDKAKQYADDRENTIRAGLVDGSMSYGEAVVMEELSRELYFSKCHRPEEDFRLLAGAGFGNVQVDTAFWKQVWGDEEKIMYASTPMFSIRAIKEE